ncbi:MAG TPA: hypothetical protein VEM59_04850 [Acidimicrobiia bacterium]|nr:hypothetical protein [Acidimicrobiia bacterium]
MAYPGISGGGVPPGPVAGEYARAHAQAAAAQNRLPSAEVLQGMDDERRVRRLRRVLRFWRLFGRVR